MTEVAGEAVRCGRPTKKDMPCRQFPEDGLDGCFRHLTIEEQKVYDNREAEHRAWVQRSRGAAIPGLPAEPACWSWPIDEAALDAEAEQWPALARESPTFRMDLWQDGRCAICGRRGDLVQDHDHQTGLIRGDLCRSCNVMEGQYGRGGVFALYRQKNPATMFGVKERYWDPFNGFAEPGPPPWTKEEMWEHNPMRGVGL